MHGKLSTIAHDASGLFAGLPQHFKAVRYHSLVVDRPTCPEALKVCALSEDGEINRAALGRLVFSDPEKREQLNRLTHPAVRAAWMLWLADQDARQARGNILADAVPNQRVRPDAPRDRRRL